MAGTSIVNVSNQSMPFNCQAKILAYTASLTAATEDTLDLVNTLLQGQISGLQALYIDNRLNGSPILVSVQGSLYSVQCRKNAQGWFPILVIPGQEVFTFTSAGGVDVKLFFSNVPMPLGVWDV